MAGNAKEIAEKLNTLFDMGGAGNTAVCNALEKACLKIEGEAKRKVPVKTGTLRNSITHKTDSRTLEGAVGTSVPYAPYVEIGTGIHSSQGNGRDTPWIYTDPKTGEKIFTRGSKPHPFLKPALDENTGEILKYFENIL